MFQRLCVCTACILIAAAPVHAPAASKEILDLQRDVAQLQDQVRQLQKSQDQQLAALTVLVQQTVDASQKAYTAVAVIQSNMQQSLRDMESKVVAPVVGLTTRMDSVSSDLHAVQQAVSDLNASVQKIQAQLTDLTNAVKVMQTPAPPPPGTTSTDAGGGAAAQPETPTMSATDLYQAAQRDYLSGKPDLALREFNQYLKWYGNTDFAANAQFYIGFIHYSQNDFETAASDFDMVLEKYTDNPKTPDAIYYKGMSLVRLPGQKTSAKEEFLEVIRRFPKSDQAKLACNQLKELGVQCPVPGAPARSGAKKKSKK